LRQDVRRGAGTGQFCRPISSAAGFFFNSPNGGWEYPAFRAITLIVQALLGNGAYAVGGRSN
jgi:hypothetical protein